MSNTNINMKAEHPTRQLARQLISETRAKRSQMAQGIAKEIKTDNVSSVLLFPVKSTATAIDRQVNFDQMIAYHNEIHQRSFDQQIINELNTTKYIKRWGNEVKEEPQGIFARMMFRCFYRK